MATKTHTEELTQVLLGKLKSLYDMEQEIIPALAEMEEGATNSKLKEGFKKHREETEMQASRLEDAFRLLDEEPDEKSYKTIRGLISDASEIMDMDVSPEMKDTLLANAARAVEHYEMVEYMGSIALAQACGEEGIANFLKKNLEEETATDEKLQVIAQRCLASVTAA